jgi:hypothetical protein
VSDATRRARSPEFRRATASARRRASADRIRERERLPVEGCRQTRSALQRRGRELQALAPAVGFDLTAALRLFRRRPLVGTNQSMVAGTP